MIRSFSFPDRRK